MTFKEQLLAARKALGDAKVDAIIDRLKTELGHCPTQRQELDALEPAIGADTPRVTTSPAKAAQLKADADAIIDRLQKERVNSSASPAELCAQYDALTSEEQRRAFWKTHAKTLSGPKAKVGGLVLVCMSAAKPLSLRSRFQLPATRKTSPGSKKENAAELLEEYKILTSQKERAAFIKQHLETLQDSESGVSQMALRYIAAGKDIPAVVRAGMHFAAEQPVQEPASSESRSAGAKTPRERLADVFTRANSTAEQPVQKLASSESRSAGAKTPRERLAECFHVGE